MTKWNKEKIGEVCSFITDGSHNPPKGISQSEYLMLSSKDVQNGKLNFTNPRFLSKNDFEIENRRTNLQLDDVLLTTVGTIGRTAIYKGIPANVTFQRSVSILRPILEKITPQYLMYYLDSITHILTSESRGVAQQGIYLNQLKKIEITYPPLSDQKKIVEILEDHLSRLDAALDDVKQAKLKAAQFRRSLLRDAFTGNRSADGSRLMISSEIWKVAPLSELVDVLDSLRVPVNANERSKRAGSVPYYGATGQVGTIDKAIFNEELLILGEDGVQFFDPSKPKAYKISGPAWVNNHAHVLRPRKEKILLNFLLHFLNQFNYVGYANGTTRLKLTQGAMNKIPVQFPPLSVQKEIVESLEEYFSHLDAALATADAIEGQSLSLRRSLLKSAFNGQLTKEVPIV